jgi:hypothetical protein
VTGEPESPPEDPLPEELPLEEPLPEDPPLEPPPEEQPLDFAPPESSPPPEAPSGTAPSLDSAGFEAPEDAVVHAETRGAATSARPQRTQERTFMPGGSAIPMPRASRPEMLGDLGVTRRGAARYVAPASAGSTAPRRGAYAESQWAYLRKRGSPMSNAYTTQLRALLCPNCGAPVTTAPQGGSFQCGYCRTVGNFTARMDARPHTAPPSPAEEQARLVRLRFQYDQGPQASPYTMYVAPEDVMHLAQLRPPQSWGPWFEAWKSAVARLAMAPTEVNQKRVFWLAQLTGAAVLNMAVTDPARGRAIRETALELLPDPGHKHILRCALSSAASVQRDFQSAEQWLAACDPYPSNLTLDTVYRLSSSYLHLAHGRWAAILETLGNQPNAIPIDHARDFLAGMLRVHACEELGYPQAADGQLRYWFEAEKKMDGPVVLGILKTNAPLGLCQRTCARLGIQIPQ